MTAVLLVVMQTALMIAVAPLWSALVATLKARMQMRSGPPIWQGYADLARLAGKETVIADIASPLARFAPTLALAAMLAACTWTPVITTRATFGFAGDLVMTVALLAALRVLVALLALEAGTSFGGMAASRHLALSALAEPALMLAVFALAIRAQSTDLATISASVAATPDSWISPSHLLALAAVAVVTLSETGRIPFDNPATHLELTMIHEGLVLDLSGRHLAMIEWANALRRILLLTLLANLFLPWGIATTDAPLALLLGLGAWVLKLLVFAVAVAVLESVSARVRLFRVPELLGMAFLLALLALTSDSLIR